MFKCEFCNTELKSPSSLNYHKNNAKYCLNLQNKDSVNKVFICEYCNTELKSNKALNYHSKICDKKYISIIEKLENKINEKNIYIASLEAKIEIYEKDHNVISDIAKQTKITNTNTNNIINNLAVYDATKITENFSNKLEYITKYDIINGQKGIATILAPCLYDDNGNKMLMCTDKSRLIFTKLDENNNRIKDFELKNLATIIKPLALKKADEIVEEHNKLKDKVYNIDNLKIENIDYKKYIKKFQTIIDDCKKTNTNHRMIMDYENKLKEYEKKINYNENLINKSENISYDVIEDDNEKLLDGRTEIKYLDSESSKFARQLSKII